MLTIETKTIIHKRERLLSEADIIRLDGLELLLVVVAENIRGQTLIPVRARYNPEQTQKRLPRRRLTQILSQLGIIASLTKEKSAMIEEFGRQPSLMKNAHRLATQVNVARLRKAVIMVKDALTAFERDLGRSIAEVHILPDAQFYENVKRQGLESRSTATRFIQNAENPLLKAEIKIPMGWGGNDCRVFDA